MSIAQKIFDLRVEIMKQHPDAKIVSIEMSPMAEMLLAEELRRLHGDLAAAPVQLTYVPRKIKKIFDVEVKIASHDIFNERK